MTRADVSFETTWQNVNFPISVVCLREIKVQGSIRYQTGCHPTAVDLVASGKLDIKELITHRYRFEQSEEAFRKVKAREEGTLKVIIEGVRDQENIGGSSFEYIEQISRLNYIALN